MRHEGDVALGREVDQRLRVLVAPHRAEHPAHLVGLGEESRRVAGALFQAGAGGMTVERPAPP